MRFFLLTITLALASFGSSERERRVDAIFSEYTAPGSPGCAVGVLERGHTVLAKGYGLADLEQRIPISPKSRFYMASVSKQFAALAILIAEREGKLKLDDSIRRYVPEMPAYADGITIRRMLDHTAGLREFLALWALRGFTNESVLREDATLGLIARQKALNFEPGTDHSYSNSGYLLAAIALKRAVGVPLDAYAREKIFVPLGMNASRFQADHGLPVPDRAHGYHRRDGGWKGVDVAFDLIGSGGMYSSVEDMLRWARNFDEPAVGKGLLETLQTPGRLIDGRRTPGGYALGMIEKDGAYSHAGVAAGYSTDFVRVPKRGLSVVCLCNAGAVPVARLSAKVREVYTGEASVEEKLPGPGTLRHEAKSVAVGAIEGTYWSEELRSMWEIRRRDGRLFLFHDGVPTEVTRSREGVYQAGAAEIIAVSSGLQVSTGRARGIEFVRR